MTQRLHHKLGFSLVESILVLLISASLLIVCERSLVRISSDTAYTASLKEFSDLYEYGQLYASLYDKEVIFRIANGKVEIYDLKEPYTRGNFYRSIQLAEGIKVSSLVAEKFKASTGYIKPQTITFYNSKRKDKFVIQMGSGRYIWK